MRVSAFSGSWAGPGLQHEAAVAIRAFDELFVAHVEIDARMSERGIAPVAGDDASFDLDGFGRLHSLAMERDFGTPALLPLRRGGAS